MAGNILQKPLLARGRISRNAAREKPLRRWNIKGENLAGYLFILPSIIGFTVFVLYPMLFSSYTALTQWDGISTPKFNGLDNFIYMFTKDPLFWKSLGATFYYVILAVPTTIASGLGLALLLNRRARGIGFFRTIFYLPAVLPLVATLTLWRFIFEPRLGLANAILMFFHLPTSMWLSGEATAVPSLVLINLWASIGITMVIFTGALQGVPADVYEAAALDGAGKIRSFFNITLPMISPIIFLQIILQMIGALQAFTQVHVLTKGAPNNATNFLMYKIYTNGFGTLSSYPDMGYATAQVWILFLIILIITALTFKFSSIWVYEDNNLG